MILSNSALHLSLTGEVSQSLAADCTAAAIKYQTEAVSITKRRLSADLTKTATDMLDATIGTVSGLVCNAVSFYSCQRRKTIFCP